MNYNELNAHPRDKNICFDPATHEYTCDGRVFRPVTTLVEDCFDKFDAQYWAGRKATAAHPAEELLAEWATKGRIARDLGTLMHDRIERYYLGEAIGPEADDDPTFSRFLRFAAEHRLRPFRTEWRIYMEEHDLAGTLDFLGTDADGNYEIWDWKRSSKLIDCNGRVIDSNPWGKHAHAPVGHLPDTTFHHYALQVSVYRYILSHKYGVTPAHAHLGVFHPDHSTYHVVDVPYLEREVEAILQ